MPTLASNKYVTINPSAVTEWQTKTYIGIAASSDDNTFTRGIYEYGSLNAQFSDVLNYTFSVTSGSTAGTWLTIGCVFGCGDSLYYSYKDGAFYGVDKVVKNGPAMTTGEWESLIFDSGTPLKSKAALKLIIRFSPLIAGESVTPKFKIDRATNWTVCSASTATLGATRAEYTFNADDSQRYREIQYGFTLNSTNGTYPKVLSVSFEYDTLINEVYSS